MDGVDERLLCALMENARMPLTQLAKRTSISRELTAYRIKRLVRQRIILGFFTEIDIGRLGYCGGAVFLSVKAGAEGRLRAYLEENRSVSWVAELSGIWNFGLSIVGKTVGQVDEKFMEMYELFREDIIDHRFALHKRSQFFYEKYFGAAVERKSHEGKKRIDAIDKLLLKRLSKDARAEYAALAKDVSLTGPAVRARIRALENAGYITRYSLFVNFAELGAYQYSIFITNKKEKNRLVAYLSEHESVSFLAEYAGDTFLEFGLLVKNPYEVRRILQEIETAFPDNRLLEISLFQRELVSTGPPPCIFD